MLRRFFLSCRLFFLMYAHSFFVSSVRGSGLLPTIFYSAASGCTGFMNAAFGFLFVAFFAMSSSPLNVGRPSFCYRGAAASIGCTIILIIALLYHSVLKNLHGRRRGRPHPRKTPAGPERGLAVSRAISRPRGRTPSRRSR